jgi:serine/threonine-protein kinase
MMKKAGLIVLLVLVALGLFDRVLMPFIVRSGSVSTVPDVTGMLYEDAAYRLERKGFDPEKRYHVKYLSGVDSNVVLSQMPEAGANAKPGRSVSLVVNRREKPTYPMPDLIGRPEVEARQALKRFDLIIDDVQITSVYSREEDGRVLSQSVPVGVPVKPGAAVSVIVGLYEESDEGVRKVIVPEVLGMSLSQAERVIAGAGLERGRVRREYSAILVPNTVISQKPSVSAYVSPGEKIDLTVVTGD